MRIPNIKAYFSTYIKLKSALLPEEEQLSDREFEFLLNCCMINYEGVDLNDFGAVVENSEHLPFINRRNDVSVYKLKLSTKKWIISKRGVFGFPRALDLIKQEDGILMWSGDRRIKVKKVSFEIAPYYEFRE